MPKAKLQVCYTLPELAAMSGMHRHKVRRLLESNGVPLHRSGRALVVFLSELKRALPELWDSMLEVTSRAA